MTKNSNWDNLSKNLVTFKRYNGVNDKKKLHFGSSLKDPIFRVL